MKKTKYITIMAMLAVGLASTAIQVGASEANPTINFFISKDNWGENSRAVTQNEDYQFIQTDNKVSTYLAWENLDYKISEFESFSFTTKQSDGSKNTQNAYINIYTNTGTGSDAASWYGSRLNIETYFSENRENYPATETLYNWSTDIKDTDPYLTIFDDSPNRGGQQGGGYNNQATLADLATGPVQIINGTTTSRDYSTESIKGIAINVNDTQNNMPNDGLSIYSATAKFAGENYKWNFLSEGNTWTVEDGSSQIAKDINGIKVVAKNASNVVIDNATYTGTQDYVATDKLINAVVVAESGSNLSMTNSVVENQKYEGGGSNMGLYSAGVHVSGDKTIATIADSSFKNNKLNSYGMVHNGADNSQAQGAAVYASNGDKNDVTTTLKVSETVFENNEAQGSKYGLGGAIYSRNAAFTGENLTFTGNKVLGGTAAQGGAIMAFNKVDPSDFEIKNSTFENNQAVGLNVDSIATGGALVLALAKNGSLIEDTTFTNNAAINEHAASDTTASIHSGAVYYAGSGGDSDLTIRATKDISNVGNYVQIGNEKRDDKGGFLYINSSNKTNTIFDIADSATMTIGDGTAGYDSIANNPLKAENTTITKQGAGTMTVNSSMEYYTGALNVTAGTMNVNNGFGGKATVDGGATANFNNVHYLGKEDVFVESTLKENPSIYAKENATLNLTNSSFKYQNVENGDQWGIYSTGIYLDKNSTATLDNVDFISNYAKADNVSEKGQAQGVGIYATDGADLTVRNSDFIGNTAEGIDSGIGTAIYAKNVDLKIEEGSNFINNTAISTRETLDGDSKYAQGGAIIAYHNADNSGISIKNSSFEGNKVIGNSAESYVSGGALLFSISKEGTYLEDVEFKNNAVINEAAFGETDRVQGGAIYNIIKGASMTIKATKDMTYSGNYVQVGDEKRDDRGGFMHISSSTGASNTIFDIDDGATLTVGNGTAGYDSISSNASNSQNITITKQGSGTMTVNSSMEYYTGALNVTAGIMNVNNGLGAEKTVVSGGASLNVDNVSVSKDNLTSTSALTFVEVKDTSLFDSDSISLNLSNSNITGMGQFDGAVTALFDAGESTVDNINVSITGNEGDVYSSNIAGQVKSFTSKGVTNINKIDMIVENSNVGETYSSGYISGGNATVGSVNTTINNSKIAVANAIAYMDGNSSLNITGDVSFKMNNTEVAAILGTAQHGTSSLNVAGKLTYDITDSTISSKFYAAGYSMDGSSATFDSIVVNLTDTSIGGTMLAKGFAVSASDSSNITNGIEVNTYGDVSIATLKLGSNAILNNYGDLTGNLELAGAAIFNIENNASIVGDIKGDTNSVINKNGASTLTVNSSMQNFTGALNVTAGIMSINNGLGASSISISDGAILNLNLGKVTSSDFTNDGTLNLSKGTLGSDGSYTMSSYTGAGTVNPFGGTFDSSTFTFTVGETTNIASSTITSEFEETVAAYENIVIDNKVEISTGDTDITISHAAELADTTINGLDVLSAWEFTVEGVSEENSVVLSFLVGEGLDMSQVQVQHREDGGDWTDVTATLEGLFYEDGTLGFVATGFSDYAVTAVPEPSTYAMIFGALALGFAYYRKRK